ncbi:BRO-N domain-containing protein [Komagataeibacter europaeus]|uniref:BRO-N domain-containing protein n=1 Tax=Komagataeibacter europaeus TaxID=33995 RepID=UPI0022AC31A9|nr:BRO family protein [Komagataeibacter europaeus]
MDRRTIITTNLAGSNRRTIMISEAGLYRLILRSDKPNARPFQDWVTQTALPTLRKEGVYVRDEEKVADASSVEDLDSLNDMIVGLMKRKTELLEARLAEKEAIIQKQAPKVSAYVDVWQPKADLHL